MKSFEIGEHIGEYEILARMAEGGMGVIFYARHRLMNRVVAIKVAKLSRENETLLSQMFRREIEASARLSHRNVLTVFDAGIKNGLPYLVTEYVSGGDLQTRVARSGPLTVLQAIDYAIQAAEGLQAIHDSGIIHRDVKPANLLIDEHSTIKILDFGISKLVDLRPVPETDGGLSQGLRQDIPPPDETWTAQPPPSWADGVEGIAATQFRTVIKGNPLEDAPSGPSGAWDGAPKTGHRLAADQLDTAAHAAGGAEFPSPADHGQVGSPSEAERRDQPGNDDYATQVGGVAGGDLSSGGAAQTARHVTASSPATQVGRSFVQHVFATDAARTIIRRQEDDETRNAWAAVGGQGDTAPGEPATGIGTPAFASPEQWAEPESVDFRSDIYSLGCTLFFLLTGEPIVAGGARDVLRQKIAGKTRRPSELRADVYPGLDRVVARMTAVHPAARYDSMASVKLALEQVGAQPRVFISYRREDSLDATDRLYMSLGRTIEKDSLFMDVDSIPAGVDFRDHIASAVAACDVFLAVIGDHWLQPNQGTGKRRIDDPADFVRLEILSALQHNLPVIPVLVGQARMPSMLDLPSDLEPLAFKNAAEIRAGSNYDEQVDRLASEILSIWKATRA